MIGLAQETLTLVCPVCRRPLTRQAEGLQCAACSRGFEYEMGFPNLIVGDRFEDVSDPELNAYEEVSNRHTAEHYLIPHFRRILGRSRSAPKLLSVGCGNGIDIDLLTDAGFDATGIDCGMRCVAWAGRRHTSRLYLANGKHLPFEDHTFDLAYCGCVFPHVGVEGDSDRVSKHYLKERLELAREMVRVLKPGGYVLVSSPNRWCPLDIFHGRTPSNPLPRLNSPSNPFLLSPADYKLLFGQAGCSDARLLPPSGYWGFVRRRNSVKGQLVALPVQLLFQLASFPFLSWIRGTAVSPWIVMLLRRGFAT